MVDSSIDNSKLKNNIFRRMVISALSMAVVASGYAATGSKDLSRLGVEGTELTPAGAIRAGNAKGTIPAWENKPIKAPSGFKEGTFHPDPFASDKVLFTISSSNYLQYEDNLTAGQKKMFESYPDYFMNIYKTRRTAVFKPYIYKAALENAKKSESF